MTDTTAIAAVAPTPTEVSAAPPYQGLHATLKRGVDLALAGAGLVVAAPLIALVALAIAVDSRGPVFFRQVRVGHNGRRFSVWKFRTMVRDADRLTDALQALSLDPRWLLLEHDPRITRVGRLLRRSSLDELPQLLNVLRGDMTLVGPRPLSVRDDEQVPAWAAARRLAVPGLTGPWQVSGRTSLSFDRMLELDCDYVARWSWRRDLATLLRTVPAVLGARGAN